ncbi:DUF2155 domain-containing protein [Paracoccus alkanivorans]|uniref:DUF2155 domain-containing protein n=1 Tax=Paracoccus alkanivorans TaxID=2116655 RepID=A0A3M0MC82_9RHOB|nr:DUF2155 domain-containing protein [Paracoccus alkanivorans]RMC35378.1 DUF2155 domain-containing protein [Paracoccus alkanivorans]
MNLWWQRRGVAVCTALLLSTLSGAGAIAQEKSAEDIASQERVVRAGGALLRGLDKVSGRTTDLRLQVGDAVRLGRLEIRLGECRYPADDPSSDAFAQLTITDLSENVTRFSGWMIASSPALSALDDARYDVWVISCQI